jgi:ATP sulfurylase
LKYETQRQPITTVLKRELNLIKRRSLTGEALFSELKKLYTQHEMRDWLDRRRLEGEEQPIPIILCSQALV